MDIVRAHRPDFIKRESLKTTLRESPRHKENIKPPPPRSAAPQPPPRSAERWPTKKNQSVELGLLDRLDYYCSETYPQDSLLLRINMRLRESVAEMVTAHQRLQKRMKEMYEKDKTQSSHMLRQEAGFESVLQLAQYLGDDADSTTDISLLCTRLGSHVKSLEDQNRNMRIQHERSLSMSLRKISKLENEISQKRQEEKSLRSHQNETTTQLQTYEFEVTKLHRKLEHTQETISSQSFRIEALSEEEHEAQVRCSELESQVQHLQHSVQSEREINNRINHEIELHVCKNKVLHNKHVALSNQVEKERKKLQDAEERLVRAQEHLESSERNLKEMQTYSSQLEDRISVLESALETNRQDFDERLVRKAIECDKIRDELSRIAAEYKEHRQSVARTNLKEIECLARRTEQKFKRMSEQESVLQEQILSIANSRDKHSICPVEFQVRINWDAACSRFGRIQVDRFLNGVSVALSEHWLLALVMINDTYSPILPYYEDERLNRCSECLVTFGFFRKRYNCMLCGKLICSGCKHRERLMRKNTTCKPCRDLVRMVSFSTHSPKVNRR